MKKLISLAIVGCLLIVGRGRTSAAASPSDWPQLNADAAQSNFNALEKNLPARKYLGLKVRWTAPIASVSYPIVAGGRVYVPFVANYKVHVRVLDAATGKQMAVFAKDALGGLTYAAGSLYLAGHLLQWVDPSTGQKLGQISPSPKVQGGVFLSPLVDSKVVVSGYAGVKAGATNSLYVLDLQSSQIRWKVPSLNAMAAIGAGRIMTQVATGSAFYDEVSGKTLAREANMYSEWFAGTTLNYSVAAVKRGPATLYAIDGTGQRIWKRVVGGPFITSGWPHAATPSTIYVQSLRPRLGIEALDPESGAVKWFQGIPNIQRIAVADGVAYVLTYGLGEPVRLVGIRTTTGKVIGAHVLSTGYYAFSGANQLMVADGMVFIRVVDSRGSGYLVALG